jgi:catechol 2,3-dioxygenase-like lactoylglutathione lyase family enzyme
MLTEPRWTHLALPCSDIDRSVEFYTTMTPLVVVARNEDENGRGAWLSNDGQVETPFVLVLAEFPPAVARQLGQAVGEPVPVLAPFAHIGIELPSRAKRTSLDPCAGTQDCGAGTPDGSSGRPPA